MTSFACRLSGPWVTAAGAGEPVQFKPAVHHIASCLRCQAAVARHRRLGRTLSTLADAEVPAPAALGSAHVAAGGRSVRQHLVLAGAALAVAVAGVLGFRRRLLG